MLSDFRHIQSVLHSLAVDTGRLLLDFYSRGDFAVEAKADHSPVTTADVRAQELILSRLEKCFPHIPIVSEELADGANRAAMGEEFFIVDPLDCTKNFITGIPFFDVSLALIHQGVSVVGVVHDPAHDITYSAYRGGGATKNAKPVRVRPCASLREADLDINTTKLPTESYRRVVLDIMPRAKKVRYFGGAVLETCWIAAGALDGMLNHHLSTWDIAATTLILEEAGGMWGDLAGIAYRMDTAERRPLLACGDRRLFSEIISVLGRPE
jgi:myo-inositol-1(or 4)-monophosphatase